MATTPSLVPPTCTPPLQLCTDVRSVRLRCPSIWSPALLPPPTSDHGALATWLLLPSLPLSLLTPTVPLCQLSPLMLLRPVRLISPPLPRLEGRSVRLRCPSTSSPV